MDVRRAEVVWDIVALHASSAIAQHKSPETAVANSGISIDVRGAGVDRLPADAVRRVLDAFPRAGFPEAFHRTLVDEVRRNPDAVRLSWMEGMAVRHVDGYRAADFEAGLLDSSGFQLARRAHRGPRASATTAGRRATASGVGSESGSGVVLPKSRLVRTLGRSRRHVESFPGCPPGPTGDATVRRRMAVL